MFRPASGGDAAAAELKAEHQNLLRERGALFSRFSGSLPLLPGPPLLPGQAEVAPTKPNEEGQALNGTNTTTHLHNNSSFDHHYTSAA